METKNLFDEIYRIESEYFLKYYTMAGFNEAKEEIIKLLDASRPVQAKVMQADICEKCDQSGGKKTYANQVCMPLNGKVRCIDWCIHQIVAALNAGGVETVACCCGHNQIKGRIDLADGRILWIEKPA